MVQELVTPDKVLETLLLLQCSYSFCCQICPSAAAATAAAAAAAVSHLHC
jgi:hypothetical protein